MRAFEKFVLFFGHGLARFAGSRVAPRVFSVLEASDSDVVNFCIWKSLSGVGRTYLHNVQCPLLGGQKFVRDCLGLGCKKMISVEYFRTGVISKLREGFRSIGLTSNWDERSSSGNPALARQVARYLNMVQEQQAKAGISQK